ncbi:MAG: hypothetical protein AAFX06_21330 [Planctomycetota bacterium]
MFREDTDGGIAVNTGLGENFQCDMYFNLHLLREFSMPARKPVTDQEKALALNYPSKGSRNRAIVYWKGQSLDLGPYRSAESFFTLLALREHLAQGHQPPQMKALRESAIRHERPDGWNDAVAERDRLRDQAEWMQAAMGDQEDAILATLERRDELKALNTTLNQEIADLKSRRPWRTWGLTALVAIAAVFAFSKLWIGLPPSVDGEVLSAVERGAVRQIRINASATQRRTRINATSDTDRVLERMQRKAQEAKEWRDSQENQHLANR